MSKYADRIARWKAANPGAVAGFTAWEYFDHRWVDKRHYVTLRGRPGGSSSLVDLVNVDAERAGSLQPLPNDRVEFLGEDHHGSRIWLVAGRVLSIGLPRETTHDQVQRALESHDERVAEKPYERPYLTDPEILGNRPTPGVREHIRVAVRDQVWRRDHGRCVRCGSNERIEIDHIVPVIEGGRSTYRNLQLLCERCNRRKGRKLETDWDQY